MALHGPRIVVPASLQREQGAIRRYCEYARDPGNPFVDQGLELTGRTIPQICNRRNTVRNVKYTSKRRQFTRMELDRFFAAKREHIAAATSKRVYLARCTQYGVEAALLAFGPRDVEARLADVADLHPAVTPEIAEYSAFEDFSIRFGKSHNGGGWKPRTVVAPYVFRESLAVLKWYLEEIPPRIETRPDARHALFPSSSGGRFCESAISVFVSNDVERAGLSPDLTAHCFRHTFETMLHEAGCELPAISVQMGHESDATTLIYDHMGGDIIKGHSRLASSASAQEPIPGHLRCELQVICDDRVSAPSIERRYAVS